MSIIEKKLRLKGPLGEREVIVLFDSGASVSCIRPELAEELEQPIPLYPPMQISTANEVDSIIVDKLVALAFYIGDLRFVSDFYLVPKLTEEVIIGVSTMQQWRFKLDFEKEEVIIDPRVTRMRI